MPSHVLRRGNLYLPLGLAIALSGCVAAPVAALMQAMPAGKALTTPDAPAACQQLAGTSASGPSDPGSLHALGSAALAAVTGFGIGTAQQAYDTASASCLPTKVQGTPASGQPQATAVPGSNGRS